MGLFYFRSPANRQANTRRKVSIPVDGAFLFQVGIYWLHPERSDGVSIPVDGAFLFQEPQKRQTWLSRTCFNPRRWGFFISGTTVESTVAPDHVSIPVDGAFLFQANAVEAFAQPQPSFNPRRWGFFISGVKIIVAREDTTRFNPRRWGFFISGFALSIAGFLVNKVSIPVDGAFLFQA